MTNELQEFNPDKIYIDCPKLAEVLELLSRVIVVGDSPKISSTIGNVGGVIYQISVMDLQTAEEEGISEVSDEGQVLFDTR
jgi:hypothetical protein